MAAGDSAPETGLRRCKTGRALVLGDGIGIFLAVVRALGRRGVEVHVAPCDWGAPGLASRYITATHSLPPYHADPDAWAAALARLVADYDFDLVLPCSDSDLRILARHADRIGRDRAALPNRSAFAAFTDKARTRALAQDLGIPIADGCEITPQITSDELMRKLDLPLVLKPRSSYVLGQYETKQAAVIVRERRELDHLLSTDLAGGWLAERFFAGEGVGVSVLADRGRIVLEWQHRRLRTATPTGASTARVGEPIDAALRVHVEALAAATELHGVAMFEFRRTPGGSHILLEVNPRFWGSLPLAQAAGADFAGHLWDLLTRGECRPQPPRRTRITRRSLTGEFDRIVDAGRANAPAARLRALGEMLASAARLAFTSPFDSWSSDDPAPFRLERRQLARRTATAIVSRFRAA